MMQFSSEGFWGRGIYFALNSSYSHHYSLGGSGTGSIMSGIVCERF